MLSIRLIKLIETHADALTHEVVEDLLTNEYTPAFHRIPAGDLAPRVLRLYQHLGNWIGDPKDDAIRVEYEDWGRIRCRQGVPLSEVVYSLILTKKHLRRYIREHASIIFSGDAVTPGEFVPLELFSIQELNYVVGDFFDRALYYLTRGHEKQAENKHHAAAV
ncbi:MAG TPA: hypothetical protein VGF19_15230 [Candidatus Acidoferrum sp.]